MKPSSADPLRPARFAAFCIAAAGAAFSISLCAIGIGLYAVLLPLSLIRHGKTFPAFPHLVFLIPLVISTGVSAVLSIYPDESFRGILKFLQGIFLCYAGFELIQSRRDLNRFVGVFMTCQVVAASSALWQEWSGMDFIRMRPPMHYTDTITRLTGPFNHCNDFATFLMPGLVLAVAYGVIAWLEGRRRSGMGWAVVTVMLSYVMMRTISRGAVIGLFAAFVIIAAGSRWRIRVLAGIAAVFALLMSVPSSFRTRLVELCDLNGSGFQERWYLLKGTWKMVEVHPWFGMGLNTYSRWFPIFNPTDPDAPVLMYAHNSYAQIAAERGLIGLGLLILFWLAVLNSGVRAAIHSKESDRWLQSAFVAVTIGILINALFDSLMQSTQLHTLFWMLLGVTAALSRREIVWDKKSV